jgi:hypothetical protein
VAGSALAAATVAKGPDSHYVEGVRLSFAATRAPLLAAMKRTGLEEKIGQELIDESIEHSIRAFLIFQNQMATQAKEAE